MDFDRHFIPVLSVLLLVFLVWAGYSDYQNSLAQHQHYCEMIELYKALAVQICSDRGPCE